MRAVMMVALCALGLNAAAEYPELTAIKQHAMKKLQLHSATMAGVDPQFEGVVNFGKSLKTFTAESDIEKLTNRSKDYWRAQLEMDLASPGVLMARAYMHLAQGDIARGERFLFLASLTSAGAYKREIEEYGTLRAALAKRVKAVVMAGARLRDREKFPQARQVYDVVLREYPDSAWAWYESGFSYLTESALAATNGMASAKCAELKARSAERYARCREIDPFYWKAYQGGDQKVIAQLVALMDAVAFLEGKARGVEGLRGFAVSCDKVELHDFAAHAEWILVRCDSARAKEHLKSFLDHLDKLQLAEINFFRSQFKLD